jgi:CheY-like chemotaxis protein
MSRILVVDDDISFRKMLRLTLTKLGHAVTEARDGNEALEVIREAPVDLVMTDLIMPGREGVETIEALRHEYPALKIIAMSGGGRMSAFQYLEIARCMGAHRTLEKPFSTVALEQAIAAVLAPPVEPAARVNGNSDLNLSGRPLMNSDFP